MIFYRKPMKEGASLPMRVKRVRVLSLLALVTYPVGAILALLGDLNDVAAFAVGGLLLVFVALVAFVGMVGTGVQRIAGEEDAKLDPVEMDLRHRTYSRAYNYVSSAFLVALLYLAIASDTQDSIGLWVPSTFDHWSGVMWGGILLVMVLPTAILSWSLPEEEIVDDGA